MRLIAIIFCSSIIFNGCAGKKSIRDIDYEAELEKGKLALSKKKYVRAQDHFNTVVIGALILSLVMMHCFILEKLIFILGKSY